MLFANISSTLKTLAAIILVVLIIVSIIGAIAVLATDEGLWLLALGILICGVFSAIVCACILYGLGELIEQATIIAKNTQPTSGSTSAPLSHVSKPANTTSDNNFSDTSEPILDVTKSNYDNAQYTDDSYKTLEKAINTNITACIIHENTQVISRRAFQSCTNLTSITIPEGVTTIFDRAFLNCSALTCITIPHSVAYIGVDVFEGCPNLTKIICIGTQQEAKKFERKWKDRLPKNYLLIFQ